MGVRLETRTGINTGEVLVGTFGPREGIAIGDAMNLGARLEQGADPGDILLGEATHNLTMRMGLRRYTRLTNALSRKIENHAAAVALHFQFYNFARPHKSLKNPYPRTPAMAAGVADHVWTLQEIAALLD